MKTYAYKWLHIPSGKSGIKAVEYISSAEFYHDVVKWNTQQPNTWAYCPIDMAHAVLTAELVEAVFRC